MTQDTSVRLRYELEAKERKNEREDSLADRTANNQLLHPQLAPIGDDANEHSIEAIDDRGAHEFLTDFTRDELRRIRVVAPETRLTAGSAYVDLRDRGRGKLIATGQEIVGIELLVHKKDVDDEIWDKLIANPAPSEP